jgi:hypothetical protein
VASASRSRIAASFARSAASLPLRIPLRAFASGALCGLASDGIVGLRGELFVLLDELVAEAPYRKPHA